VKADSPYAPIAPVMHGDLIWLSGDCFLKYNAEKDRSIQVSVKGSQVYIDQLLASIYIEKDGKILDTLQHTNLSKLESIYFSAPISSSMLPALKQISSKKHNVGFVYMDETDTTEELEKNYQSLETLLSLFDPDWLITYMKADKTSILSSEQQLDMLYLTIEDSTINYTLPRLKNLRHLTIVADNGKIPANFLDENPQITDLVLQGDFDPAVLGKVKKLRSTFLSEADSSDLNLNNNDALERLCIRGPEQLHASKLGAYKNLSWLDLPEQETQSQFDSISQTNTGIKVIEFSGDSLIRDVSSASKWAQLRAMIIYGDSLYHKAGLADLKQLKLLSLPGGAFHDSAGIASLRRALPNTAIIPNDGACVGSGWLLLLIPLVALIRLGLKKRGV
jgi:hypothetical protein